MIKNLNFESERLKTTRLSEEDAATLFQIYSDSDAMKYRGSKPIKSMVDAVNMVTEQFSTDNNISKMRLGIRNKSNNHLIGTLLLTKDENFISKCEIGFSFGKKYWGKGYGQETLKMMEEKLRTLESIEEIEAWCIKENIASIRIFEKAGFSKIEQSKYPQSWLLVKRIIP